MESRFLSLRQWVMVLAGMLTLSVGCGPSGAFSQQDEDRNPYIPKAKQMVDERDYRAAAALYRKALLVNPQLANAHLEIGLLYDDKLSDPVAAIYHYRQYLELRPDSNKRQVVEDFIERAKLNFASRVPQSPVASPDELARWQLEKANLLQENAMLQARVAELEKQPGTRAQPVVTPPVPVPVMQVVTAPTPVVAVAPPVAVEPVRSTKTHLVQKGDTLLSLSRKYYRNDQDWVKIYAANRHNLPNERQLKIGQTLVIP